MGDGAETGAPGYKAFISYSHKDAAVGRWLHRRLEGYRLPRRLVGTEGEHGPVPARLTPIFRDREELPAAGDLSERVRGALAASEYLIVVCSPNAAASPWVAKEIATFRELHPDRPILAAIVEGEPVECFPPALTAGGRVEPLAADLRPGRDGRRLGLLKLVAALAGVGLDALAQRDAQRRVRRVTYVTALALAAVLIMAVLTVAALRERREAERQRAGAEGLVEFMLTDLRTKLRGVGRIRVMQAVNARTLRYYTDQQNRGQLSPDSALRQARILNAIAEDEVVRGDLQRALRASVEATVVVREQLRKNPDNAKLLLESARGDYWVGRIYELNRDWDKAQAQYERFATATRGLLASAPSNPDYMNEVGWSAVDLGNVTLNGLRDGAGAQRFYSTAIRWFERAARARPQDRDAPRVVANAYGWLADSFSAQGRREEALGARERQNELLEPMYRADPQNADLAFRYAMAQRALAVLRAGFGDRSTAAQALFRAYGISRHLTASDPDNGDWLFFRTAVDCQLLFGKLGIPPGVRVEDLRADVVRTVESLSQNDNPRLSDLANCRQAIATGIKRSAGK